MLSNAYFLAKFRFDTAENEPAKNLQNFRKMHFRKNAFGWAAPPEARTRPREVLYEEIQQLDQGVKEATAMRQKEAKKKAKDLESITRKAKRAQRVLDDFFNSLEKHEVHDVEERYVLAQTLLKLLEQKMNLVSQETAESNSEADSEKVSASETREVSWADEVSDDEESEDEDAEVPEVAKVAKVAEDEKPTYRDVLKKKQRD